MSLSNPIAKVKNYFIGELVSQEPDSLDAVNAILVFYVICLALALLLPLQFLYLFTMEPTQQIVGLLSVSFYTGALFYIRHTKSIMRVAWVLVGFSVMSFSLNLWLYPNMHVNNGLHLACNLIFAFNILRTTSALGFLILHVAGVGIKLLLYPLARTPDWLKPIDQPAIEKVFAFLILTALLVLLVRYYKRAHEAAVNRLKLVNQELQSAKGAAEEMNRLKSNFLANMSHEIRTPLNGVLGINELIRGQVQDPEIHEYLEIQYQSGQRLLSTIDGVLSLSKLEADQSFFSIKLVDLCVIAAEVVNNQKVLAKNNKIGMTVKTVGSVEIMVDESIIYQVISNLVGNAIKFTNPGGSVSVEVSVDSTKPTAILTVADTGIGISDQFLTRLFEPFEQESTGQGRKYQGSGLGLSISKRFVELMGGRIDVTSKQSEGTTFVVRLPIHR